MTLSIPEKKRRKAISQKKWRDTHKKEIHEYNCKYSREHPKKDYYHNRKDRHGAEYLKRAREYNRKYYEKNPEKKHAHTVNHQNRRRARKMNVGGEHFTEREFRDLCASLGNKCLCCGDSNVQLTADHVIPLILEITNSDSISNIQPLCMPCNLRKGIKTTDYRSKVSDDARLPFLSSET